MSLFQIRIEEISLISRLYIMFFCGRFLEFLSKIATFLLCSTVENGLFRQAEAAPEGGLPPPIPFNRWIPPPLPADSPALPGRPPPQRL